MEEKRALELLRGLLRNDRLPHAFLLLGEIETLRSFAKKASTLLLDAESSPDLSWEEIADPGEEDRLSASELRDRIHASLQLRPMGTRRVLVLLGMEKLSPEGRDALLKPLEEPPPATVILIGAPDANSLSETLRSRCRMLRLSDLETATGNEEFRELALRLETELQRTPDRIDPNPFLAALFGAKRSDLAKRRERAKEFLHAWIALQRSHWRDAHPAQAARGESRAQAALVALADIRRQIGPELALGGMLFSLVEGKIFATQ